MSAALHDPEFGPLPTILPLFPLGGALLLPRGNLPLNIFEPRYLNMIEDALAGDRLIGMVQPVGDPPHPVPDDAEIYAVGCAGRITSFSESGDGRYLITLTGVSRFRIEGELDLPRGYRRGAVNYDAFADDTDAEADSARLDDRQRLFEAVRDYFTATGIDADWSSMEAVPDDTLVTALAMVCPLEPRDKQALLECTDVAARGEFLRNLMEFRIRAGGDDATLPRQ